MIKFVLHPPTDLMLWFDKAIENLKGDFKQPLTEIAKDWYSVEKDWFDSQGDGRWKPLSVGYAEWKNKYFPGKRILQRSGRMYREFTGATRRYEISQKKLLITQEGVDYWQKHEYGDPSTHLPRRKVISPYMTKRKSIWHDIMVRFLKGKK